MHACVRYSVNDGGNQNQSKAKLAPNQLKTIYRGQVRMTFSLGLGLYNLFPHYGKISLE